MTIASALLWHPWQIPEEGHEDVEEFYNSESVFFQSPKSLKTIPWIARSESRVWDVEDETYYANPSFFFESYFLVNRVQVLDWGIEHYDDSYEGGLSYFAKPEFGPKTRPC